MHTTWMLLSVAAWGLIIGADEVPSEVYTSPEVSTVADLTQKSAPMGLHGYRRYFANDSLIGRPVPCTNDDKICFRYNLVLDPNHNICQPIGDGITDCELKLNKTALEQGGRAVGVCKPYEDPCPGYLMAYDGRCYRKEVVRDVICGPNAEISRNFLGEVECRGSPAAPIRIQQPQDEGRCLIPDLRFPNTTRLDIDDMPRGGEISYKCRPAQSQCFAKDLVKVKGFKGCYALLDQGPCPGEHIVALDRHAAKKNLAVGTCVHARGRCPQGYIRTRYDGQCYEERKLVLVDHKEILKNQYGENLLLPEDSDFKFLLSSSHDEVQEEQPRNLGNGRLLPSKVKHKCHLKIPIEGWSLGGFQSGMMMIRCASNNKGECPLFEVEAEPPIPEF